MDSRQACSYLEGLLNVDDEHLDPDESDFEEEMLEEVIEEEEEDNNSDSDHETTPAASTSTTSRTTSGRSTAYDWSADLRPIDKEEFQAQFGPKHELTFSDRPIDFMNLMIPELFYTKCCKETNKYAKQRQLIKRDDSWKPVTVQDMKCFYTNITFGIHQLPQLFLYFSTDELIRVSAIADVMSRDRYFQINRYFHVNDSQRYIPRDQPGHDPMFKVRPLLDNVLLNSQGYYIPGESISFDEAMIKFKGRLYFKQYIKGKPNPWGVKVWCAADPRTGYLMNFEFYTGKSNTTSDGLGYLVVMGLGEPYLNEHRTFYFDNFFTTTKLATDLLDNVHEYM